MSYPSYNNQTGFHPVQTPPAPRKGNTLRVVLIVLGVVLLVCGGATAVFVLAIGKAASDISVQASDKKADVTVKAGSCKANQFGGYDVTVIIVNHTGKTASYWAQVNLVSADEKTRLGEAHAIANNLTAGATQEVEAMGNASGFPSGAKCVIGDVR